MQNNHSSVQLQERARLPIISTKSRSSPGTEAKAVDTTDHAAVQRELTQVDGIQLLKDIEAQLRRFIWLPNERDYVIIALWIVYTHVYDLFDHAPRVALRSPVPGCGKSTLFRILKALVRLGKIWTTPTQATLFREMHASHPTILFDEMDKYLYGSNAILAVLNAGHAAGVSVPRTVGEGEEAHVVDFDVFGPVAFALKQKQLPADLAERSFQIKMQRSLMQLEKLTPVKVQEIEKIAPRISDWAKQNRVVIERGAETSTLPEEIINRAGDNWVPLFAVAEAAGGDWPQRVASAALEYEKQNAPLDRGISLLSNLKTIVENASKAFFSSDELLSTLNEREDWPWGEYAHGNGLNAHALARMLKGFGISPEQQRLTGTDTRAMGKVRGYHKRDFERAWRAFGIEGVPSGD